MAFSITEFFSQAVEPTLPVQSSLNEYLEMILPAISQYSEDLYEEEYFLDKRWLEVRDSPAFSETVLHIFQPKGDYLRSVDGNVSKGRWSILENPNLMLLERKSGEIYEVAFLNHDFFILTKHGSGEYFAMGYEPAVSGLTWREYAEKLYLQHQQNKQIVILTAVLVAMLLAFILYYLWG